MTLQQLSDAVDALQGESKRVSENAAAFLVSQVQPLATEIKDLQDRVAALEAKLTAVIGAPTKP